MTTLLGLMASIPDEQTAIVLPEPNLRMTYGNLRKQVVAVAQALAAHGIGRGDRVGMALPNGLPTILAFLAAGEAGTAAPLNPAYKEDEFRFYLEDTSARVLLLPPTGADDARRAAGETAPGERRQVRAQGDLVDLAEHDRLGRTVEVDGEEGVERFELGAVGAQRVLRQAALVGEVLEKAVDQTPQRVLQAVRSACARAA